MKISTQRAEPLLEVSRLTAQYVITSQMAADFQRMAHGLPLAPRYTHRLKFWVPGPNPGGEEVIMFGEIRDPKLSAAKIDEDTIDQLAATRYGVITTL